MISIDFECGRCHRFEGYFKDYQAFKAQLEGKLIACPLCESTEVTRKYTGCSIQAKSSDPAKIEKQNPNLFDTIKAFNRFVRDHFENVGRDFTDMARAIHCGLDEERNIYGEASSEEVKDLLEDGISVMPLIDVEDMMN
ncbi:MAG: hypothetical protein A2W19_03820 [Spirochaetes bacterium RBG_16_49_21]|nr:MAG: hypothetical protein A2W19_03820 [Spirochaetes bacterium RBG_16_49_21]